MVPSPRFCWESVGALHSDSVLEGVKEVGQTLVKIPLVQYAEVEIGGLYCAVLS